jgi:DNA processing protein
MSREPFAERIVAIDDARYPRALRHVHDPPPRIHLRGALAAEPRALDVPSIAVVGARDATAYGLAIARDLARGLAEAGIAVVSGLALGIDGAAHRGALDAGGTTFAVAGAGTDVVYPRQHRALHEAILERGVVLSEHPPGTEPRKGHFPRRNRIISGLALGVVVVEATTRSGSLSTARHAVEQGREVFAVPGPVGALRSSGPHALLKGGARLVETVDDILAELPRGVATTPAAGSVDRAALAPGMMVLIDGIRAGAATVDALAAGGGGKVAEILENLLALELRGLIVRGPGGRYALVGNGTASGTARARVGVDSPGRDR